MDSARRPQRAGRARLAILAALFVVAVGARAGDRRAGPQPTDEAIDARIADLLTRRINSPNDLVRDADGSIYFTDPPYGLEHRPDDPARELAFSGVFRIRPDGAVELISDALSRPNGIAISPDGNTLYVANSDPVHAVWTAFTRGDDGWFTAPGVPFFDATPWVGIHPGLPDGMALDRDGNLFATGPGGVLVLELVWRAPRHPGHRARDRQLRLRRERTIAPHRRRRPAAARALDLRRSRLRWLSARRA